MIIEFMVSRSLKVSDIEVDKGKLGTPVVPVRAMETRVVNMSRKQRASGLFVGA